MSLSKSKFFETSKNPITLGIRSFFKKLTKQYTDQVSVSGGMMKKTAAIFCFIITPVLIGILTDWIPQPKWITDSILFILLGVLILIFFGISYYLQFRDTNFSNEPNQPNQSDQSDQSDQISQSTANKKVGSPYIVGSPIKKPAHFFGREAEVARFFGNLNSPQIDSLQVLGLRRAGKTSFLHYVSHSDVVRERVNEPDNTLVIYIDLQNGVKTPADFYLELANGINRNLPQSNQVQLPLNNFPNRRAFVKFLDSPQLANYRLVFLLDEFERLWEDARPKDAPFNASFFTGLRSLVNTDSVHLAWVTSSYTDLYRLSAKLGKEEKTSPFFNIFDPDPLVLGALTSEEADDLIREPARNYDIKFNAEELSSIKQLAGQLPYFLQTASKTWFEAKQEDKLQFKQIEAQVKQKLASAMRYHFDWYWRHFEQQERELLKIIALKVPNGVPLFIKKFGYTDLNDLIRYGLIAIEEEDKKDQKNEEKNQKKYYIASKVFAEWIRRADLRVTDRH